METKYKRAVLIMGPFQDLSQRKIVEGAELSFSEANLSLS
jgi:hypothetical protein